LECKASRADTAGHDEADGCLVRTAHCSENAVAQIMWSRDVERDKGLREAREVAVEPKHDTAMCAHRLEHAVGERETSIGR